MKQLPLVLVLAACSSPAVTNVATPPINPDPTPPAPITSPAPAPATGSASAYLNAINLARASARVCGTQNYPAVPALAWSGKLEASSKAHSDDMRDRNYFAHENPAGPTLDQRLKTVGFTWSAYGENIAAGYGTLELVMAGWLKSPGHCSNIMSPNFTQVGLALSQGGTYRTYWTMDLGKPR